MDSCAYCVAKRTAATPVGVAVRTRRRLKLIEFDHKKLPLAMVAATGYAAILTVVDVVSRVTIFIPVTRLTAVATARAIFTRWYPMFGVPAIVRMDGDPGYTSEVMTAFSSLMGVKHREVSAPDNPTHYSMVERRNRVMEDRPRVTSRPLRTLTCIAQPPLLHATWNTSTMATQSWST